MCEKYHFPSLRGLFDFFLFLLLSLFIVLSLWGGFFSSREENAAKDRPCFGFNAIRKTHAIKIGTRFIWTRKKPSANFPPKQQTDRQLFKHKTAKIGCKAEQFQIILCSHKEKSTWYIYNFKKKIYIVIMVIIIMITITYVTESISRDLQGQILLLRTH